MDPEVVEDLNDLTSSVRETGNDSRGAYARLYDGAVYRPRERDGVLVWVRSGRPKTSTATRRPKKTIAEQEAEVRKLLDAAGIKLDPPGQKTD